MEMQSQTLEETPNPRKPTLSVRRERLLHMVASGQSIASAAKSIGISRWHASELANRPEFREELQTILLRARLELMDRLPRLTIVAMNVLEEALRASRGEIRIMAAREILRLGVPLLALCEPSYEEDANLDASAGGAAED